MVGEVCDQEVGVREITIQDPKNSTRGARFRKLTLDSEFHAAGAFSSDLKRVGNKSAKC
jgi:hypothetical protein